LAGIGDSLHTKLLKSGGLNHESTMQQWNQKSRSCGYMISWLNSFRTARQPKGVNAADATILNWKTTQTYLKDYFSNVDIGLITPRQAKGFRQWLESKRIGEGKRPLSESARRKHIAVVKQRFTAAMRLDLIQKNPFAHEISGNVTNRTRDFYITPEMTEKLLTVAPDHQWRLMIALWRLAGLRKMKIFALKWQDILRDQSPVCLCVRAKLLTTKGRAPGLSLAVPSKSTWPGLRGSRERHRGCDHAVQSVM
jgi:integrase